MAKKQTQKKSCYSRNKLSYVLVAFIILFTVGIMLLFTKNQPKEGLFQDKTKLIIEMIPDTVEINSDKLIDKELISESLVIKDPLFILDQANSIVAPLMTDSEKLVQVFLSHYNQKRFKDACDIIVDTKCDDRFKASVERFGEEFKKMDGGYQNISVHQADVPDFHSDVVCVEYDYRYEISTNPDLVHEIMSFYVQNGKITYRICEEKSRDGINIGCPIESFRDFCL